MSVRDSDDPTKPTDGQPIEEIFDGGVWGSPCNGRKNLSSPTPPGSPSCGASDGLPVTPTPLEQVLTARRRNNSPTALLARESTFTEDELMAREHAIMARAEAPAKSRLTDLLTAHLHPVINEAIVCAALSGSSTLRINMDNDGYFTLEVL